MQPVGEAILIFAKAPVAGEVKTRLIPALGADGARQLYQQLLERLLGMVCRELSCAVELWCTPDSTHPLFQHFASLPGVTLHRQQGEDLGERMAYACEEALRRQQRVILIGVDAPALTPQQLTDTFGRLACRRRCGARPGGGRGVCAVGIEAECRMPVSWHSPWGGDQVAQLTRACLERLGMALERTADPVGSRSAGGAAAPQVTGLRTSRLNRPEVSGFTQ